MFDREFAKNKSRKWAILIFQQGQLRFISPLCKIDTRQGLRFFFNFHQQRRRHVLRTWYLLFFIGTSGLCQSQEAHRHRHRYTRTIYRTQPIYHVDNMYHCIVIPHVFLPLCIPNRSGITSQINLLKCKQYVCQYHLCRHRTISRN